MTRRDGDKLNLTAAWLSIILEMNGEPLNLRGNNLCEAGSVIHEKVRAAWAYEPQTGSKDLEGARAFFFSGDREDGHEVIALRLIGSLVEHHAKTPNNRRLSFQLQFSILGRCRHLFAFLE